MARELSSACRPPRLTVTQPSSAYAAPADLACAAACTGTFFAASFGQAEFENAIIKGGRRARGVHLHRQFNRSQDFARTSLAINYIALLFFRMGLLLAADRKPAGLQAHLQLIGAESRNLGLHRNRVIRFVHRTCTG